MPFWENMMKKLEPKNAKPESRDNRTTQKPKPKVQCSKCSKELALSSRLPMYMGVVCDKCKKIECADCKEPLDSPCSWCKGTVSPAYTYLV
jgi:hypothetical protein